MSARDACPTVILDKHIKAHKACLFIMSHDHIIYFCSAKNTVSGISTHASFLSDTETRRYPSIVKQSDNTRSVRCSGCCSLSYLDSCHSKEDTRKNLPLLCCLTNWFIKHFRSGQSSSAGYESYGYTR